MHLEIADVNGYKMKTVMQKLDKQYEFLEVSFCFFLKFLLKDLLGGKSYPYRYLM